MKREKNKIKKKKFAYNYDNYMDRLDLSECARVCGIINGMNYVDMGDREGGIAARDCYKLMCNCI